MPNKIKFSKKYFDEGMDYDTYLQHVESKIDQAEGDFLEYYKLGCSRMKRWFKKAELDEETRKVLSGLNRNQNWLIITEGWCGDAGQNIPFLEKAASESPAVTVRYILRDDNEVINDYLTAGGKSIPKLIAFDDDENELFTWGPRPQGVQELMQRMKEEGAPKEDISAALQKEYNKNKGRELLSEIRALVKQHAR